MKIIEKIEISIWRYLYRLYSKLILKGRSKIFFLVNDFAYIKANSLFPDDTLKENSDLAKEAISDFRGFRKSKIKKSDNEKVNRLRKNIWSDKNIADAMSKYHLITHFYYSFGAKNKDDNPFSKEAADAMDKAISYKPNAQPITNVDLGKIIKQTKKQIKASQKSISEISVEKVESERTKIIKPLQIRASSVFAYISIFSSCVLFFGFAYTYILLWFLGIDASDFFNITDYLSSSIGRIFLVAATACIVSFFWIVKIGEEIDEDIRHEQLKTSKKVKKFDFIKRIIAAVALVLVFFAIWYATGIVLFYAIYPVVFFVLITIVFDLFKVDRYIEDRISFRVAVLAFTLSATYLGGDVVQIVYDVKKGDYKSQYNVTFRTGYENYATHDFFMANSEYVFLLDKDSNKIVVIPKDAIKEMRPKSD